MTILHVETGMTGEEVKTTILNAIRAHKVSSAQMQELFSIYFTDADVWARQEHLLQRIANTHNPDFLEEAARIVINPMMYYVHIDAKYYIFGG